MKFCALGGWVPQLGLRSLEGLRSLAVRDPSGDVCLLGAGLIWQWDIPFAVREPLLLTACLQQRQ